MTPLYVRLAAAVIRAVCQAIGGGALFSDEETTQLAGATVLALTLIWSAIDKWRTTPPPT